MIEYYTTQQVAHLLPNYSSARTLLKALHDNQKLPKEEIKNKPLSDIWNARFRFGKRWLYRKEEIDRILSEKI